MEQLDKEVIDKLSEPAKRVFRSLDYRSQRRMLKKAKEMGKQKKRKTQQKERVKKKSITKRQKKKEQAKERGSSTKRNQSRTASFVGTEIKDTSAQILQSMLLGTTMSEETYESNSEKQADMTAGKVSAEVTQKSMQGAKHGVRSLYRKRQQKKMQKQAAKKSAQSTKQGIKCIKSNSAGRKDYDKHSTVCGGKSSGMDCAAYSSFDGSYCRCNWCCDWFRGCGQQCGRLYLSGTGLGTDGVLS